MTLSLFVSAILRKMPFVGKVQEKFLIHIFTLFLSLKSRYTISNFNRYGGHSEGFYHQNLRKTFDYEKFNEILIKETAGCERFIGYDSSFLTKSGKNTPGLGRFWSGCAGATKRGLEINCICVVDVENRTGFHYGFGQSKPSEIEKLGLYESHAAVLTSRKTALQSLAGNIVVADAFFSNKTFNNCLAAAGFILLSRMQKRTKMRYKFIGVQKTGKGAKKKYGGKVDVKELDYEHFTLFAETTEDDKTEKCSEAVVYIDALKIWAKVVVVQIYEAKTDTLKSTQIFFCADKQMQGKTVLEYYHLRFQIEFLFRDAKQHLGLNQCQSTDENVLHAHWNTALTTLNVAKALQWKIEPNQTERTFSIQDIKTLYFNQLYLNRFSSAFGIDTESDKYSDIAKELLTWGKMAA